jgi:hypothetical protein
MGQSPFEWIIGKLQNNSKIESTSIISENLLKIYRKNGLGLSGNSE